MANFISEDQIEQALLQRLQHLHGFNLNTKPGGVFKGGSLFFPPLIQ